MDRQSRPTIKELSSMTGVSASTISRVINHPELVNEKTRDTVLAAIENSDFMVRRHKRKKHYVIGFTFSDAQSLFTFTLMSAIERHLTGTPYQLLLCNIQERQNIYHYFRDHMDYLQKLDALIISAAVLDEEGSAFFKSMGIPVVLLQGRCETEKSFSTNNFLGGHDAARFLMGRGYSKIAFVGWEPDDEHIRDRFMGFTTALQTEGILLPDHWHISAALSSDGGYEGTRELMNGIDRPEVIFYGCDDMAAGGFRFAREHDINVPKDLGIMGFDDLSIAETIGLTTMRQYVERKSELALEYLLGRLSGKILGTQNDEISITPRLVVRSSVR